MLGRYIFPAKVLELLETIVAVLDVGIQLTDALDELLKLGRLNAVETHVGIFD